MSQVLEIDSLDFDHDGLLHVTAFVDEMVLVRKQTLLDPPEWGPALCRGSFYLSDEDLVPATDALLRKLISDRVDDWAPVDEDD